MKDTEHDLNDIIQNSMNIILRFNDTNISVKYQHYSYKICYGLIICSIAILCFSYILLSFNDPNFDWQNFILGLASFGICGALVHLNANNLFVRIFCLFPECLFYQTLYNITKDNNFSIFCFIYNIISITLGIFQSCS